MRAWLIVSADGLFRRADSLSETKDFYCLADAERISQSAAGRREECLEIYGRENGSWAIRLK